MFLIVINAAIQQHLSSGFGAFPRGCLINHSPGELGQAGCCWLPEGQGDSLGGSQGCSGHLWDQGTRWSPPAGHCSAWCDPKSDFASPLLRGGGDAGRQEEGSSPLVLPRPGRESPKSVPALPPSVPSTKCRQHRCSASSGLPCGWEKGFVPPPRRDAPTPQF